jgi:calcium-dependent protein kinase
MGCGSSVPAPQPVQDGVSHAGESLKAVAEGGFDMSNFVSENTGKITAFYALDKIKLGEGAFGTVCKAKSKKVEGITRAVKSISKAQHKNLEKLKLEIAIMKCLDHPNIIKLIESFQDNRNYYLIMELCVGGELFDRIIDAGHFTEPQAAIVMEQMLKSIFYMHSCKLCHRDLKPENFIFVSKTKIEEDALKLIDFGLSCPFKPEQVLTTKAGTPYYVAPEVLKGSYNHECDVWALGVIMYVLLVGYPPFHGDSDADVLKAVKRGKYQVDQKEWMGVSLCAKDLIATLLVVEPKKRATAKQALEDTWVKEKAPKASKVALQNNFVENLNGFRSKNKLEKAALQIIASQFNEDQIKSLRESFIALDADNDGSLTVAEMKKGIQDAGLTETPELKQIVEGIDSNGSGCIDYTEFLAATLDKRVQIKVDVLWSAFRVFDKNGDGVISQEELKVVLGDDSVEEVVGKEKIAEILKDVDKNGDGKINFDEFNAMMKPKGETATAESSKAGKQMAA